MPATARRNLNLSTDTGFLKLIAIITMVIDHAGKMFFPQYPFLRIIGRIAFPIFCYCLTVGSLYTRSMSKYILRVFILALISQPIYVLSLDHVSGLMSALPFDSQPVQSAIMWYLYSLRSANILFTLTLGLMMIWSIQEKRFIATAVLTWAVWYFDGYINYGWQGIALILLFYAFCDRPLSSFVWGYGRKLPHIRHRLFFAGLCRAGAAANLPAHRHAHKDQQAFFLPVLSAAPGNYLSDRQICLTRTRADGKIVSWIFIQGGALHDKG